MPRSPRRRRNPNPNQYAQDIMPLMIAGVAMVASSRYFTVIDDEVIALNVAVQPVRTTLSSVISAQGQSQPPLFNILLHFWLRATGGNFEYLHVLPIILYLAGLFYLVRVARRIGGPSAALATAWTGALWPFGFHYGRLLAWYSLAFLIIALVTLVYLRYLEAQTPGRWTWFFLLGAALLWTNYFGWLVLACLAVDQWLRRRAGGTGIATRVLAGTFALWAIAFLPLLRSLHTALTFGPQRQGALTVLANAAFNVYSLFVSESVAPWYWALSIPAGLAILAAMVLVVRSAPPAARRFLYYSAFLVVVMALTGILFTRRLLLVAPWVLAPLGVAIAANVERWTRAGLALALLVVAGIGWYGVYSRRYYAAPRFLEPWLQVAGDEAFRLQSGTATVVANSPSFFLYMTYLLRVPVAANWTFMGTLPTTVHAPGIWSPEEWIVAGHPFTPTMVWIRGMNGPQNGSSPMDDAAKVLDKNCGSRVSRLMMRDQGYTWKQRFFPQLGELQWRIEIREYDCTPSGAPLEPQGSTPPVTPPPSAAAPPEPPAATPK